MIPKELKQNIEQPANKGKMELMWEAAIKSTDQMSPLLVKKMRTLWVVILIVLIGTAYIGSVAYQVRMPWTPLSQPSLNLLVDFR
jgi:hypothetical protein